MKYTKLNQDLSLSRIIHGAWRLNRWNKTTDELQQFVEQALEMGVTTFDHADIYGNYTCEALFGKVLKQKPALRKQMQIVTKCGIKLNTDKNPGQRVKYYDTSYQHIISSAEQSLKNFQTDHIDLLLIHRPSPFFDPAKTAEAFKTLQKQGKVLNFGVSNFTPAQFDMLNLHFDGKLCTNQLEFSALTLEHFYNGSIEHLLTHHIAPMVWSPLSGGRIFAPNSEQEHRTVAKLNEIAERHGLQQIESVAYAWLLMHPAGFMPIVGSGKIERLKTAVEALEVQLTLEEWYEILIASQGHDMP